ncbi:Fe-S cluster assembly protein SufD [Aestuariibacter sp. GS-14]|uniref:Fe-S cluster assembly protein SufD n=1 Tax=Aestuariibacter sp. GS-14 TaxID=2590670 RepID=UPI00112AAA87|nr:Fe-S cluster assembly protein SufD [Aestuariibacter sp. GS-14]TPV56067.1 Fe-S cluster assembly protein SufD [Aestuariibacter sp. GS-14]
MSQWLSEVIAEGQRQTDWLAGHRQQATEALANIKWPVRRQEAWRFTPLLPVEKRSVSLAAAVEQHGSAPVIDGLDAYSVSFAGNKLAAQQGSVPAGLTFTLFSNANTEQQATIKALLSQVKPSHHLFGQVNDALMTEGVYIHVPANTVIDTPIRLSQLAASVGDQHLRVLVHVESGAKVAIIEDGFGDADSLNTFVSEYVLDAQAQLEHYRFAMYTQQAMHVGSCHFKVGEKAQLTSNIVGYGSVLSRLDVDVEYTGEFANANVNAIYLLAEGELFDLHSTIEHAVPNCTTEENARGIVGDRAKAVFNGRIHIHRNAQKTLAELNNRNLLLSRRAIINTKPELEIYADDVRCAHGATVAEIEEKALYYLLTRGISRSQALIMLNFGFIQELITQIPNIAISDWLLHSLRERFVSMEVK